MTLRKVLRSDHRGDQAPVLAAVGPMQFEVAVHRMATELSAPISLESLPCQVARIVDPTDAEFMAKQVSSEVLTRTDGVMLVLFSTPVAVGRLPTGQPRREAGFFGRGWRLREPAVAPLRV
jgi:peptide chain release factor 3